VLLWCNASVTMFERGQLLATDKGKLPELPLQSTNVRSSCGLKRPTTLQQLPHFIIDWGLLWSVRYLSFCNSLNDRPVNMKLVIRKLPGQDLRKIYEPNAKCLNRVQQNTYFIRRTPECPDICRKSKSLRNRLFIFFLVP
jgi:hypothetical protein